jgi:predicted XRE-type DNA-binding protein
MIKSEQEYKRCLELIDGYEERLEAQRKELQAQGLTEEQIRTALEVASTLPEKILRDIREYESIKRGDFDMTCTFENIGSQLIRFRIWKGISQAELADRLGVPRQQVSRDERHEYYRASSEKIRQVLEALGVEVTIAPTPMLKKVSNE